MVLDRALGNVESRGNLFIGLATGDELQHIALAAGERLDHLIGRARDLIGQTRKLGHGLGRDRGLEDRSAARCGANGLE